MAAEMGTDWRTRGRPGVFKDCPSFESRMGSDLGESRWQDVGQRVGGGGSQHHLLGPSVICIQQTAGPGAWRALGLGLDEPPALAMLADVPAGLRQKTRKGLRKKQGRLRRRSARVTHKARG